MPLKRLIIVILLSVMCFVSTTNAQQNFSDEIGPTRVRVVQSQDPLLIPYITWGGESALFYANGGLSTQPNSIMASLGLNLKLVPGDDFMQQIRDYLAGRSPVLRGTFRMIAQASEVIGRDPRTQGVVFGQLTWSAGDHFVGRSNIRKISDLKGKKIAVQKGGPHVGMLYDMLLTARLPKSELQIIWMDELTGKNSPAEKFRIDPTVSGCFVITPDMLSLVGDYHAIGDGTGGTVKSARLVVSTATLSRSIADVYVCRKDYIDKNSVVVEKFFAGYLKGAEEVIRLKKDYEAGGSKKYMALLQMMQDIYGKSVLPTLDEDAHGLIADCAFVGQPGNMAFFNDSTNVVTGFEGFNKNGLDMAINWGFARKRHNLIRSSLDFKSPTFTNLLTTTVMTPIQRKRFKEESVRAEIETFSEEDILDDNTLISFTIQFEANQDTFSETQYREEFDRVIELASRFGNAAVAIKGHTDPSKVLFSLVKTGIKRGILKRTGTRGSYEYFMNGRSFSLEDTSELIRLIQQKKFDDGSDFDGPYQIMRAGLKLSEQRGEAVKKAILAYASRKNVRIEAEQIIPVGVGIKEPVIAKPTNSVEAAKNRRVEFALIKISSESVAEADFDF